MDTNTISKPPEGFVLDDELPEGFVLDAPRPRPDPAEEERQIKDAVKMSEKTGISPARLMRRQTMINKLFDDEAYQEAAEERQVEKKEGGAAGYWSELIDATSRGTARVGAAFSQALAAMSKRSMPYGMWAPSETPDMKKAREARAKEYQQSADLLWEVAKHPELAAQDEGKVNKAINLVGETIPYITATTAAYVVAGPMGGFAVGSMVEGNSAYKEAIESGVSDKKAKAIGVGVGIVSGAVEAFGGKLAENLLLKATAKLKNKILKAGAVFTVGTVVEALEEGAQEIAAITGEETYRDVDWNEATTRILGSMAGGAFLGGTMRGASIATKRLTQIPDKPIAERGMKPVTPTKEHAKLEKELTQAIQEKTGLPEAEAKTVAQNAIDDKFYAPPEETEAPPIKEAVKPKPPKPAEATVTEGKGEVLYHGTEETFEAGEIEEGRGNLRQGIYLSGSEETAKTYGKNIHKYTLSPDAKILDLSDGESTLNFILEEGILEKDDIDVDLENYILEGRIFQVDPYNKQGIVDDIMATAKDKGFHVVKLFDDLSGESDNIATVVLDKKVLQAPAEAKGKGEGVIPEKMNYEKWRAEITRITAKPASEQTGVEKRFREETWPKKEIRAISKKYDEQTDVAFDTLDKLGAMDRVKNRVPLSNWTKAQQKIILKNEKLWEKLSKEDREETTAFLKKHFEELKAKQAPATTAPKEVVKKEGDEPSGGVSWQTAMDNVLKLAEKDRPKVVAEQKEKLSKNVGAMRGTRKWLHEKKGLSAKDAIHRSAGQLKGALTNYEGRYQALSEILEPWTIEAAFEDIYNQTEAGTLTDFDSINLTNNDGNGAWDKMLRGAAMTPGDVKLIRKWQPILAKEAESRVPLSSKVWSGLEWMLGTLKFGAAFDVQIRRQARWLRGSHPVLFTKAVGRDLAAYMSKKYADKMAAETEASPYHSDKSGLGAQRFGLKFLPRQPKSSEQRPEQFFSSLPEKVPWLGEYLGKAYEKTGGKVGKAYAASMRGFVDSFNWMQQKMWDMQIEKWKGDNVKITQKMLHDLADFQNTMLGMSKPKTDFGGAVNRVMRPVMWSPSLTWSRIRTPSLMITNPTMRGEVAKALSTYIGTGLMFLAAASMIAKWWGKDDPVEWDTDSSDFGKIKIGNTRWDVYGDGGPYIRAMLQAWSGTKTNEAGRVTTKEGFERLDPFKQLLRNKRAPALDMFAKIWSGRNYYGGDAWALPDYDAMRKEGGLKAEFADWHEKQMEDRSKEIPFFISKEVYERYMPFFVQSTLEAAWFDGWPQALGAGTDEFFSGQALTYEPSTNSELQMLQDISATQEHDKLWDDLTPRQQERLYKDIPEMEQLEMKKASEKMPPEEISLVKQNRAARRIFKAMPADVKKELNAAGVKISAPARKIGDFFLNDERYKAYEEYSRQEIEERLSKTISTIKWGRMDSVKRMKELKEDITKAKADARDRVLKEIKRDKL